MGSLQTIMDDLKIDKDDLKCIGILCIIIFIIYTHYSTKIIKLIRYPKSFIKHRKIRMSHH